jgi:hypothetical protein
MIKTFEEFISDKYGDVTNESQYSKLNRDHNNIKDDVVEESVAMVSAVVASSVAMSRNRRSSGSSKRYYNDDVDKSSKGAKIINAVIKSIFTVGGMLLVQPFASSFIGIIVLVIMCLGIFGNFKAFIDKNILRNNLDESLINEELITEGNIKDFFEEKVIKAAMKNNKIKAICEEIMKRDDFKEAKNENSIKKLIKCAISYFKENKNREKEFKQIQSEIEKEK